MLNMKLHATAEPGGSEPAASFAGTDKPPYWDAAVAHLLKRDRILKN